MTRRGWRAVSVGRNRHRNAALALAGVLGVMGVALSACSNDGTSLAQQACVHVDKSIKLYTQAEHSSNAARAEQEANEAVEQLEAAEPLAAAANSANPAFNPLMTTLQEIGRTSEANLVQALEAQCAAAENPTGAGGLGGPATTT